MRNKIVSRIHDLTAKGSQPFHYPLPSIILVPSFVRVSWNDKLMPLFTDLSHAVRALRRSPALAVIAIVSLALGIGANVTVYSVVSELILDDMSARQPTQLARIDAAMSYPSYRDLQRAGVFQDLAFETGLGDSNWNAGTHTEHTWQLSTSANFFDVLGVAASSGRLYSQVDEGRQVVVVSNGFWRKRLRSDPNIIGHALQLNERLYTVLGVLPRDYRSILGHGVSPEVYRLARTDSTNCHVFGRLRDGFTREQTRQALLAAVPLIRGENMSDQDFTRRVSIPRPMAGLAAHAASLGDDRRYFLFFVALFGTALLLSIIACFNVAGLLLARGVSRQRELAIRKALGANRLQLARHLLAEGFVLVVLGAGVGHVLAQVPTVGMDDLFLLGDGVVDLLGFVAGAADAAAGARRVVERAAVVVAHLDQHEVARLRGGEDLVPTTLGLEGAAAAATDGVILDLDFRLVEESRNRIAPPLLPFRAGLHRRVADDKQCRHSWSGIVGHSCERGDTYNGGGSQDGAHGFSLRYGLIEVAALHSRQRRCSMNSAQTNIARRRTQGTIAPP